MSQQDGATPPLPFDLSSRPSRDLLATCLALPAHSSEDELRLQREASLLRAGVDPPSRRASLLAWLQLQATLGLAPERALDLLRAHGSPTAALRAAGERLPGLTPRRLAASAEKLAAHAIALVPITAPEYPDRLRRLVDAAPALFLQGDARHLGGRAVAIVGSRAATVYGLGVARELAAGLSRAGVVVVSGLARGVDSAAHEGALEAGGATVAVQACGLDRVYPAEHARLASRIREQGAIIGELPPGAPPRAPYFPLRNRLIAGLAEALVVVEARVRSGSLITARHALDQGGACEVMAVPGPITAPPSEGPNQLIRDGARPVLGVADVLEELGLSAEPTLEGATPAGLSGVERELVAQLPASRDELARRLDRSPGQLAFILLELELRGEIREDRDGQLRLVGRLA